MIMNYTKHLFLHFNHKECGWILNFYGFYGKMSCRCQISVPKELISLASVSQLVCSMLVVPRTNNAGDGLSQGMQAKHVHRLRTKSPSLKSYSYICLFLKMNN